MWSGPWLRDMAGLDRAGIAGVLFWTAAAMTAGYVIIGFITERLSQLGIKPLTTAAWGMLLFMVVQVLLMAAPVNWAAPLWMLFGFIGTAGVIPYPALAISFPPHSPAGSSTGLNVIVFIAAFAAQWGIGAVITLLFPRDGCRQLRAPKAIKRALPSSLHCRRYASPGISFQSPINHGPDRPPAE